MVIVLYHEISRCLAESELDCRNQLQNLEVVSVEE